jgi:hypothetical protein
MACSGKRRLDGMPPNVRRTSLAKDLAGEVPRLSVVDLNLAAGLATPQTTQVAVAAGTRAPQEVQNTGVGVRRGVWGSYCMTIPSSAGLSHLAALTAVRSGLVI